MQRYYCGKCDRETPFLNEQEWQQIETLIPLAKQELIKYRKSNHCDLKTARENCHPQVTQVFEIITGLSGIHFGIITYHRLSKWGEECPKCKHLLRTSKASFCANCGWKPKHRQ